MRRYYRYNLKTGQIRKGIKPLSEDEYKKLPIQEADKYVPLED